LAFYSPTITMMHGPINIRFMLMFGRNFQAGSGPHTASHPMGIGLVIRMKQLAN